MGRQARLKAMRKQMRSQDVKLDWVEFPHGKSIPIVVNMQKRMYLQDKNHQLIALPIDEGRKVIHKRGFTVITRREWEVDRLDNRQHIKSTEAPKKKPKTLKERVTNLRRPLGKFIPFVPKRHGELKRRKAA